MLYYSCSHKKDGCNGKASIEVIKRLSEEGGEILTEYRLASVTTPEVHAEVHEPDKAAIYQLHIVAAMKAEIAKNPLQSISALVY